MSAPRALTLAAQCDHEDAFEVACARELRRLYEEGVQMRDQRDELLEALKGLLVRVADDEDYGPDHAITVARVAITKATGEKS